jgi:hypothetical protein
MPQFYKDVEAEIDLSVDEFIELCSERDINKFIDTLKSTGRWFILNSSREDSIIETEFNDMLIKIHQNRLRLTNEEDELLKKIANRF